MSDIHNIMESFLRQIYKAVKDGNKNKVISLINEMKNFYMVEENLKPGKNKQPKEKLEKPIEVIGKEIKHQIPDYPTIQNPDKPRRHIFY